MLKFVSVLKLTGIVALVSSLCFCSVVPRGLPLAQYNSKYKRMVARVFGAMVWPCTLLALIFRKEDADINKVLNSLVLSFLVGYPAICLFELIACTASRVLILKFTEPEVFKLTPKVPGIILPWTMQSNGYFPSRFTLILFSVVNSCILAPALEEFFKVKFLRLVLPQTEEELKKVNANDRDRVAKKLIAESPVQMPITIRTYLVYMMAICSGLKMADSVRRILLYAKPHQKHKTFFALARGLFPVHEICGALSALDMARRGVLGGAGMDIKSLLPAILLRSAAAFRGLRPFYMWASDRPWDELQLQAWGFEDSATPHQLVLTGAANCLWFLVLASQVHTILTQHVLLTRQFIMKLRDKKLEEEKFMF